MDRQNYNQQERRIEPSAPPFYMMPEISPSAEDRNIRERSPPPRYEDAIADDQWPRSPAVAPTTTDNRLLSSGESPFQETGHRRPNSCNSSRITSPSHQLWNSGNTNASNVTDLRSRPNIGRYRSASPGDLSDGSYDERDSFNDDTSNAMRRAAQRHSRSETAVVERSNKKRSSGSRIKKGLENIAFLIIQILD